MTDRPDDPTPPSDRRPSRGEVRLWERCARQEWPIDPARQSRVVLVLLDLVDPPDGIAASPRVQVAAAKALAAFGALALGQQRVDLRLPEPPDPGRVDVRDALFAEAESLVSRRIEERAAALARTKPLEPPP